MVGSQRDQEEEQLLMDMIAQNQNNPQNKEVLDHREADSYLNMSGDGNEGGEQPIDQRSNDDQQAEI